MPPRITIVGAGHLGASIGLGLKKAKLGYEIVGHDKNVGAANKAKQIGAIDKVEWNLINAVEGAGLVILAIPVDAIKPTLEAIAPYLTEGCVVTDTASTKQQVLAWAEAILPRTVNFVGGHPLVAKTDKGTASASADLFAGATYCLMPGAWAKAEAVELLVGLASTLGAKPYFLDAAEHDNFVAAVDHLPILMAAALMNVVAVSPSHRDLRKMSGGDFQQATALAAAEATTTTQICVANREGLVRWLDAYIQELSHLRGLVAAGGPELQPDLEKAADSRALWLSRADDADSEAMRAASDSAGEQMRRFFLGDLGRKRGK